MFFYFFFAHFCNLFFTKRKLNFIVFYMTDSAKKLWANCLSFIKDNIKNDEAFKTWFKPIVPVKLEGENFSIQVPSKFFYEWIEEHYFDLLKSFLTRELGENAKLIYMVKMDNNIDANQNHVNIISGSTKSPVTSQEVNMPFSNSNSKISNPFIIPGIKDVAVESQLNHSYSFDNFIEGDSNRLGRSASLALAQNPGKTSFNPLFLFGEVGLGKTHLAHAIGIEIKEKFPNKTVLYISAEKFIQQYSEATKRNTRNDFIHFYQIIDVLIVDDVQFLSGKKGTQDVFFQIFNHLHQNKKQIVLTSDKAPIQIQDIEQRLLSRFKWGLSAELQKPDLETRIQILKEKIKKDGIPINDEILKYIAENIKTNIRELEGAIISIVAESSFNKVDITPELVKKVISKFVKKSNKELSIKTIQKIVADYFQMDIETLKSKTRQRHIVQARQLSMYFSKKYIKTSLSNIGMETGNKDHATVLHACKTVENLSFTDKKFKTALEDIKKKITNL